MNAREVGAPRVELHFDSLDDASEVRQAEPTCAVSDADDASNSEDEENTETDERLPEFRGRGGLLRLGSVHARLIGTRSGPSIAFCYMSDRHTSVAGLDDEVRWSLPMTPATKPS